MRTHPRFQAWAPHGGFRCGRPTGFSGVGPQSANLGALNPASGERLGCFSRFHSPGAEGGGVPVVVAAVESSRPRLWVPLFSFSFWEILPFQAPLVQTSTWLLTQLSLALSQESCSRPCAWAGGFSRAGPRDLIVLKHSSYHHIFQCPLSLVSDLHRCWNTVGCSLCSSDQLGVSLVLRGSGLRSHLSRCHLREHPWFTVLIASDRHYNLATNHSRNWCGIIPSTSIKIEVYSSYFNI